MLAALWEMLRSGELVVNAARSLTRAAAGLAAAVVVGVAAGLFMATFRRSGFW